MIFLYLHISIFEYIKFLHKQKFLKTKRVKESTWHHSTFEHRQECLNSKPKKIIYRSKDDEIREKIG